MKNQWQVKPTLESAKILGWRRALVGHPAQVATRKSNDNRRLLTQAATLTKLTMRSKGCEQ